MLRPTTIRPWRVDYGIWFRNWKPDSIINEQDFKKHLKRLLVYYPKNIQALKLLSLKTQEDISQADSQELLRLKKAVLAKYSKGYIRQISNPLQKQNIAPATTVKLSIENSKDPQSGMLRTAKHLNSLELSIYPSQYSSYHFTKSLKYIKSVTSLTLRELADITLEYYKRLFRHLRDSVKCLTISRGLWDKSQKGLNLSLLEFLLRFPNLKVFRLDAGCLKGLDIRDIPLDILQQKGLKFDVRVCHSGSDDSFVSSKNSQALSNIEVLGLNNKRWFGTRSPTWDQIQEAQLGIQKKTQGNLLYINYMPITTKILFNLFSTCRNISTLNMLLTAPLEENLNFSGLCELSSLRNIFVEFYDLRKPFASLFNSLATLAKTHKKLEFVSFDLSGCADIDEEFTTVQTFFEASTEALKKAILKFCVDDNLLKGIPVFYQGLQKLKQISSLSLLIENSDGDPNFGCPDEELCRCHHNHLIHLFENLNTLTELDLTLPDLHDKDFPISLPISLQKLSLHIPHERPWLELLEDLPTLVSLHQLSLTLSSMEEKTWTKLSKFVQKSDQLEIVKLRFSSEDFRVPLEDLTLLMKNKQNIKLILVERVIRKDREHFIFARKGYQSDVQGFLRLGSYGIPVRDLPQKSYFFD